MHQPDGDIEAFVQTADSNAVLKVLSAVLGDLGPGTSINGIARIHSRGRATVQIQRSAAGYLSVWLRGCTPWRDSMSLARFLAASLCCRVRCEPDDGFPNVSPYSSIFLQIDEGQETLVDWDGTANDRDILS